MLSSHMRIKTIGENEILLLRRNKYIKSDFDS